MEATCNLCGRRVGARRGVTRGVTKLRREAGLGLVLQCLLLWLFRRWKRKESHRLELLTLAISLPDALACAAVLTSFSLRVLLSQSPSS